MEPFFLVLHVLIATALIGVVLIQRSSTDGFGLGSGSGSNFMSGRQAANFLTRVTAILATLFILNSLWLGWLATHSARMSLADQVEAAADAKNTKAPDASDDKASATDAPTKDASTKDEPAVQTEKQVSKTRDDKAKGAETEKFSDKPAGKKDAQPAVPLAE